MKPQITWVSWVMILFLGVIWGSTFMVIELALKGVSPLWVAAARIIFAAPLLGMVWAGFGLRFWREGHKGSFWALMLNSILSFTLPFILIAWGQQYVTSGFVGIAMTSVPIWVLPLAHFFVEGEPLTLRRVLGVAFGFLGVIVLVGPSALRLGSGIELWAQMACIGATMCYALGAIVLRRLPPVDPIGLSAVLTLLAAVTIVPIAFLAEGIPPMPPRPALWAVVILGLVPTAFATLLRVYVLRTAGPSFMTLTNFQVPLWAVFFGIVFLQEPTPANLWVALGLVLFGLGLSQYGALRRLFERAYGKRSV